MSFQICLVANNVKAETNFLLKETNVLHKEINMFFKYVLGDQVQIKGLKSLRAYLHVETYLHTCICMCISVSKATGRA